MDKEMNCIHCHGQMKRSNAPFHVDRNGYHLMFDTVPAWVCDQCGEAYFEEREVAAIQSAVKELDQQARLIGIRERMSTMLTTKIEWNIDMEIMPIKLKIEDRGEEKEARIAGRCKSCWGGLIGRMNEANEWTGIKCRVCETKVEGQDAAEEHKRMSNEGITNLMNIDSGRDPEYGDGLFVQKVFPSIERQTEKEIRTRINQRRADGNKQGKLTRNSFPAGAPGLLFLQAKILIKGVEDLSNLHERPITELVDLEVQNDGSILADKAMEKMREDGKYLEYSMIRQMGCYMSAAMLVAFACELAMKAICLTCKDEAIQDHDLLELYQDLPRASQRRTKADYKEIEKVMQDGRHTFGKWRYFETNVGEKGMRGMIDLERTLKMAKAARVILDEAEMIGLTGSIDAKEQVSVIGQKETYNQKIDLKITGRERPPKNI